MTKNPTREELGRRDMLLRSTAIAATAALASSTAAQPTFAQAQAQTIKEPIVLWRGCQRFEAVPVGAQQMGHGHGIEAIVFGG